MTKMEFVLTTIITFSYKLDILHTNNQLSKMTNKHIQTKIAEKIALVDSKYKDTLTLRLGLDYLCKVNQDDSSLVFTIIKKKKLSIIRKFNCLQIIMFTDNTKCIVQSQSFYSSSIPISDYFFMTGNNGHIFLYSRRNFYIDKKESFGRDSFTERVIKPILKAHKNIEFRP